MRDSHIAAASKPPDFKVDLEDEDIGVSNYILLLSSNPFQLKVKTGDIVDLASDEEGGDALDEADQLLEQLDLLSSD